MAIFHSTRGVVIVVTVKPVLQLNRKHVASVLTIGVSFADRLYVAMATSLSC